MTGMDSLALGAIVIPGMLFGIALLAALCDLAEWLGRRWRN